MPSWNDLIQELNSYEAQTALAKMKEKQVGALKRIGELCGGWNVIFYGSAFLQKPNAPAQDLQVGYEDINGFMSVMYGMDWSKNLILILHTPGGMATAAETIVEYLHQKFMEIKVIVPTYAMSAGTMMALAFDKIILGRQSQLGPIDPQFIFASGVISANAIIEQFEEAKNEIVATPMKAHAYAPILQAMGPALVVQARNEIEYGKRMVGKWLSRRMFKTRADCREIGERVAKFFSDAKEHKSHGRRISRDEAEKQGVQIEHLESNQALQEEVLTLYHLMTIAFQRSACVKMIASSSDTGRFWIKSWA